MYFRNLTKYDFINFYLEKTIYQSYQRSIMNFPRDIQKVLATKDSELVNYYSIRKQEIQNRIRPESKILSGKYSIWLKFSKIKYHKNERK
jgi:hypothetical protein